MLETLRIRPSRKVYGAIVTMFLVLTVVFFWLALSTIDLQSGLLPAVFGIAFGWMASVLIRRPFALELSADGLMVETPFGDSFFDWSGFESFAIKYADPITKHVVFKLKPGIDVPRLYRRLRMADREVGLFPYFETRNKELLQIMRRYRYRA